ncbi:lysophospholipid acyltransferase family protein [Pseudoalteromonas fenneropenaei]|uniref:Lysophospholipid acyltransferase family protein n=1 Tax=Pseudoalteromonas fenneropenaei TaxID=1737459 RepID=A0ABV7CGQ7_9GAMM
MIKKYLYLRSKFHNMQQFDPRQTVIPPCIPRTHSRFGRWLGKALLRAMGWRVAGAFPSTSKFVAAVAPHTSNWDFIIGIAVKLSLGVKIRFLGKHTIFIWPFGMLLRHWGGIPVDRRAANGVVGEAGAIFAAHEQLILGIAPEGTRKYSKEWKTGFLHIAKAANVPVVPMALDYRNKTFVVMPEEYLGDDLGAELQRIKALFPIEMAKYPEQVSGQQHKS